MTSKLTQEDAVAVAQLILSSFRAYRQAFREITLAAKTRFERTAWIDATDLRYDRDNGNAVTDLSRRQVDGMALMRFPR